MPQPNQCWGFTWDYSHWQLNQPIRRFMCDYSHWQPNRPKRGSCVIAFPGNTSYVPYIVMWPPHNTIWLKWPPYNTIWTLATVYYHLIGHCVIPFENCGHRIIPFYPNFTNSIFTLPVQNGISQESQHQNETYCLPWVSDLFVENFWNSLPLNCFL